MGRLANLKANQPFRALFGYGFLACFIGIAGIGAAVSVEDFQHWIVLGFGLGLVLPVLTRPVLVANPEPASLLLKVWMWSFVSVPVVQRFLPEDGRGMGLLLLWVFGYFGSWFWFWSDASVVRAEDAVSDP